jgi:Methyltransferase domain
MLTSAKHQILQRVFDRFFTWRVSEFTGSQLIALDYPVAPRPRYLPATAAHPELWAWFDRQRTSCEATLDLIARWQPELEAIAPEPGAADAPHWNNQFFTGLDGMSLYALVADRRPSRIVEVGSGNSTKFAAHAIRAQGLSTHLTSIDPNPRAQIDRLCHRVVREPLERVDTRLFAELDAGDFLFVDSSHRSFTNSDVSMFFLEVLPRLAPGILVHVHDVFLPWDYPAEWSFRYYSEQYLLACWILANPDSLRLVASNAFASYDAALRASVVRLIGPTKLAYMLEPAFNCGLVPGLLGMSIWFETVGRR